MRYETIWFKLVYVNLKKNKMCDNTKEVGMFYPVSRVFAKYFDYCIFQNTYMIWSVFI